MSGEKGKKKNLVLKNRFFFAIMVKIVYKREDIYSKFKSRLERNEWKRSRPG